MSTSTEASKIFERTVAFSLEVGRFGILRKASNATVGTKEGTDGIDQRRVAATKKILDCKEYEDILKLDRAIRAEMKKLALPSILRSGVYLVPTEFVPKIDDMAETYKSDREAAVDALLLVYRERAEASKSALGALAKDSDYPEETAVRRQFYVDTKYLDMGLPKTLEEVSQEIFEREQAKAEETWKNAAQEIETCLCKALVDLVNHLSERLAGTDDNGKPKIFRATTVTKLQEFIENFRPRNISNSKELNVVVDQLKALIGGVDPEMIRSGGLVRTQVATSILTIKDTLDTMLENRPRRVITFRDDE